MTLSKLFSWEPLIYQVHDLISMINNETKRRTENLKIQVLKDISFLEFDLKAIFKNASQFRKFCLIMINVDKNISRNCKIGHCYIREDVSVYVMINCDFIIFKNCNHCIKDSIPVQYILFCSLNSIHDLKTKWNIIQVER